MVATLLAAPSWGCLLPPPRGLVTLLSGDAVHWLLIYEAGYLWVLFCASGPMTDPDGRVSSAQDAPAVNVGVEGNVKTVTVSDVSLY